MFRLSRDASQRLRAEDVTLRDGSLITGTELLPTAAARGLLPPGVVFPEHTTQTLPDGRLRGTVKWFDMKKVRPTCA